jgi:hypothetical protein
VVERSPHHLKGKGSSLATTSSSVTENDGKIFKKVFGQSDSMVEEFTPHHLKVLGLSPTTTATAGSRNGNDGKNVFKTIWLSRSWHNN